MSEAPSQSGKEDSEFPLKSAMILFSQGALHNAAVYVLAIRPVEAGVEVFVHGDECGPGTHDLISFYCAGW